MHILFDLDDTLFPSTEFSRLARENALKEMIVKGLNLKNLGLSYEQFREMLYEIIREKGSNYSYHFDELLKKLGFSEKERNRLVAAAVVRYHNTKASIQPYPEVPRVLSLLKREHLLYIASDGISKKQWEKLYLMNLDLYFDDVFISEDLKISKSPEFYRKVAELLKTSPRNCVMVGDREDKDIIPSKEVGMFAVRVKRGKYANDESIADIVIDSLEELPSFLQKVHRKSF